MHRLALAISLVAIPAVALAAPAGTYRGGGVSFEVSGGKVREFRTTVTAICPSGSTRIKVRAPAARIRDNRFRRRYKPIRTIDQKVTVKGRFRGRRASGTVRGGPICVFSEGWRARKR